MRQVTSSVLVALAGAAFLGSLGCGGKIAPDGTDPGGEPPDTSSGGTAPPFGRSSSPAQPAPPVGKNLSLEDACDAICEHKGKCGAHTIDCVARCVSEGHASTCGAEATAYRTCHGAWVEEGSCVLPPVCEPAYCAYTRCAGIYVPPYCP